MWCINVLKMSIWINKKGNKPNWTYPFYPSHSSNCLSKEVLQEVMADVRCQCKVKYAICTPGCWRTSGKISATVSLTDRLPRQQVLDPSAGLLRPGRTSRGHTQLSEPEKKSKRVVRLQVQVKQGQTGQWRPGFVRFHRTGKGLDHGV